MAFLMYSFLTVNHIPGLEFNNWYIILYNRTLIFCNVQRQINFLLDKYNLICMHPIRIGTTESIWTSYFRALMIIMLV